jgi:hypothetical protein
MVVMATQGNFGRLDYIFAEFSIFGDLRVIIYLL